MEIKVYTNINDPELENWDALVQESVTDTPFQRYGYSQRWWQYRGGGEWPMKSSLMIFSGWAGDRLLGLAPLFLTSDAGSHPTLHLLGSIEISDYLDFIARSEDMYPFVRALLTFLSTGSMKNVGTISLVNIPQESPTLAALESNAREMGWQYQVEKAYPTPGIRLANDWETYLSGIDKKQRHEIRRKLRRADEEATPIRFYFAENEGNLLNEINAFFQLMELDEQKKEFLTPMMREQMLAILRWASDEQILQLAFLEIDGQKAAAYCCFDYNQRVYVYNSGFNSAYSSYSPGWVLLSYLIQDAIVKGKTHFDFMRGGETYKYRFGAEDGFVMRAVLHRQPV